MKSKEMEDAIHDLALELSATWDALYRFVKKADKITRKMPHSNEKRSYEMFISNVDSFSDSVDDLLDVTNKLP